MRISDWRSDVCSSDLNCIAEAAQPVVTKPPPCGGFFVPGPRSPGKRSAPGTCGPREKRCVCKLVGAGANALGGKCPPASACGRRLLLDFAPKDKIGRESCRERVGTYQSASVV